jgi:glycosyltransferase involved in cell wall biosynthesis
MKISIIIPSFNQGKFLDRCISSIINQNFYDVELIIIDGGSKDESIDVIIKYQKYISYWVSEPDAGQSQAINKGISKCTGDIINFIACDDYLEPGSLERINNVFTNKSIDIYCGVACLWNEGQIIGKKMTCNYTYSWPFTLAFGQNMEPATFWRRKIYLEMTPFKEDLHFVMDGYMWLKYIIKYGFDKIFYDYNFIVANVDFQPNAKSIKNIEKFQAELDIVYSWLYKALRESNIESKSKDEVFFTCTAFKEYENIEKIEFYRKLDYMFIRNLNGKRMKLKYINFINLLFSHPYWIFKYYLIERKHMRSLRKISNKN